MKIAFCGASGTGKSTMANYISEKYGYPQNPVGSRSVAKAMGYDNPYDVDAAGKRVEFQRRLVIDKVAWEAETPSFVTDRTTFDNLVYTVLHGVTGADEDYIERAIAGLKQYDVIFYCPYDVFLNTAGDPHRVESLAYHRLYDAALVGCFINLAPRIVLTKFTVEGKEERKAVIDTVLGANP